MHLLAFFLTPLRALLGGFVGETRKSFLHLFLNVFGIDFRFYGAFVALTFVFASSATLLGIALTVVAFVFFLAVFRAEARLRHCFLDVYLLFADALAFFLGVVAAMGACCLGAAFAAAFLTRTCGLVDRGQVYLSDNFQLRAGRRGSITEYASIVFFRCFCFCRFRFGSLFCRFFHCIILFGSLCFDCVGSGSGRCFRLGLGLRFYLRFGFLNRFWLRLGLRLRFHLDLRLRFGFRLWFRFCGHGLLRFCLRFGFRSAFGCMFRFSGSSLFGSVKVDFAQNARTACMWNGGLYLVCARTLFRRLLFLTFLFFSGGKVI